MSLALGRLLFSFRGRLPRGRFWWTAIAVGSAFVVLLVFLESLLGRSASLVLYPPLAWIALALGIKRLHDRGKTALWLALVLIPVIGPLWLAFELGFRRGTPGENQYGSDPLTEDADYMVVS